MCQLAWIPAGSPVTIQMQTSSRPMIREEQADLNLSQNCTTGCTSIRLLFGLPGNPHFTERSPLACLVAIDILNIVFVLMVCLVFN